MRCTVYCISGFQLHCFLSAVLTKDVERCYLLLEPKKSLWLKVNQPPQEQHLCYVTAARLNRSEV